MNDQRVYPSEIAPAGFAPARGDPDPMGDFAPAQEAETPARPADRPYPRPVPEPVPEILTHMGAPDEAEAPSEPPPPRPDVEYLGSEGQRVYFLLYPVIVGNLTLREVTIGQLSLWDVQDFLAGRIKTNVELLSRMSGIDPVSLGALKWPDVEALLSMVTALIPDFIREAIEKS